MFSRLESERLVYRKLQEEDLMFFYQVLQNPQVCLYLPGPKIYPKEIIKRFYDFYKESFSVEERQLVYLVLEKDSFKPIGYAGIQPVKEFKQIEIFYVLDEPFWNKGYATEVSLRMKELAKEVGLDYVIGLADIRNLASQKVLEKTGFQKIEQIDLWGLTLFFYDLKL